MFGVFNGHLQTDMGRRPIVRRQLKTADAQAIWANFSEHMTTSSKGVSVKRKLTHYITNTILDSSVRGTTEQFVLHFNEQFQKLEDISKEHEKLPESIKMTLLQNAG